MSTSILIDNRWSIRRVHVAAGWRYLVIDRQTGDFVDGDWPTEEAAVQAAHELARK